ncbi:CO dehydrogenase/acetyl-CoA synthase complex subunit epsilon, partial [Candidatus Bathyarchaeota archaeon]|nr:CO dehydrogenase/acetyl-CoA synthase complex subunit epsilon [Candidatus Bathyarchaeota archaeon]
SEVSLKEGGTPMDWSIRVSRASGIPILATGHAVKGFIERGFKPGAYMSAVDVANRLIDPGWEGLDGKGQYELAIFIGFHYYLAWNLLSGLKHFSQNIKTLSLDRFYQPHASLSLPNLSVDEWEVYLKALEDALRSG